MDPRNKERWRSWLVAALRSLAKRVATNRVERRVFLVLFVFTLVPLTVLGYLGVRQFERQALDQTALQLRASTNVYAEMLLRRLARTSIELHTLLANAPDRIETWAAEIGPIRAVGSPVEPLQGRIPRFARAADGFWMDVGGPSGAQRFLIDLDAVWDSLADTGYGLQRCLVVDGDKARCGNSPFPGDPLSVTVNVPLAEAFETDVDLAVTTSIDRDLALGPVIFLSWLLPIVVAVTGLLVTFVAMRFVRRRLRPLSELHEATQRLQRGDYGYRVATDSGDEFDALGAAFNAMTERLDRSFSSMKALAQIDRLILSSAPPDEIVKRVLAICDEETDIRSRLVLWRDRPDGRYWRYERSHGNLVSSPLDDSIGRFEGKLGAIDDFLDKLREFADMRFDHWLPVHIEKRFSGVLLIESRLEALPPDLFKKLSDLTDRLAVAVTHFDRAETLYRQAHFDPLTGLINRYAFEDRLKQAVRQAQRDRSTGALLYIDLDRFKQVNDTEGHKAGDRLLLHVADRIKRCVRANDTIARLGGDEFAIIVHKFDAQA